MQNVMLDFRIEGHTMRYSQFVPRFYNLCKSYGFEPGSIMPSRAFCSDESQGFPIILITKHFGAFPFDHGLVGGIVATDRHGPHTHHGKDLAIIQASHVGYDAETGDFGTYRRLQTAPPVHTSACGKIDAVLHWYLREYGFARENVYFSLMDGLPVVVVDNQFLDVHREEGLVLSLDRIIDAAGRTGGEPVHVLSTSQVFPVHPELKKGIPDSVWRSRVRTPIGDRLTADLFCFQRRISNTLEGRDQLERNLGRYMAQIVTARYPALTAAMANTQVEFDRTYRTLVTEPGYQGKNLAFIAGINIDVSPITGQRFPLTKFVPWAAYIQTRKGSQMILEQKEVLDALNAQSLANPDRIQLSDAIRVMEETPEIRIRLSDV